MKNTLLLLLICITQSNAQQKPNVYINCATTQTRCYRDYLYQTIDNFIFSSTVNPRMGQIDEIDF